MKKSILLQEGHVFDLPSGHSSVGRPGRYVVYKTALDGGGMGHGPHDVFPDGHHVFAELLEDTKVTIDFYQTGCFTRMIENIKPVGAAARQWLFQDTLRRSTSRVKIDKHNRMEEMRKALAEVQQAALGWWEGRRPLNFDLLEHSRHCEVNCPSVTEQRLARAVSAATEIGAL